jgi:hypothetical protein
MIIGQQNPDFVVFFIHLAGFERNGRASRLSRHFAIFMAAQSVPSITGRFGAAVCHHNFYSS